MDLLLYDWALNGGLGWLCKIVIDTKANLILFDDILLSSIYIITNLGFAGQYRRDNLSFGHSKLLHLKFIKLSHLTDLEVLRIIGGLDSTLHRICHGIRLYQLLFVF